MTVTAERALLHTLEGGCQVPVASLARVEGDELVLDGLVAALDGAELVRGEARGPVTEASALGVKLAEDLVSRGAGAILDAIREAEGHSG